MSGVKDVEFRRVTEDKKRYLPLLLLADEQEDMIDRYLGRGEMYVLDDGGVKCVCVATDEGDGVLEVKNLATAPAFRRRGYAREMLAFLERHYRGRFSVMQVARATAR